MAEGLAQEPREGFRRHLADPHGERAVANAAEAADMAIDRDVVGRVGKHEVGALALQQTIKALGQP